MSYRASSRPYHQRPVEFVTALLHLFAIDAMRNSHPAFYAVARAAQVITDEALTVDWDKVGEFIKAWIQLASATVGLIPRVK